ncbi:hypothetical protein BN129_646 [Cronobacter sakazakii 701]|nr:hypothetical protein BN129_646 [Cronobacter sakazakii 701]
MPFFDAPRGLTMNFINQSWRSIKKYCRAKHHHRTRQAVR